jgi:hypothetical protein
LETHKPAFALHFGVYNFARQHYSLGTTPAVAAGLEEKPLELRTGRGNDRRLHAAEILLAGAKPIFTLVTYRRIEKFPDNQTKRADNS